MSAQTPSLPTPRRTRTSSALRLCGSDNCTSDARYECPRCALPYCSVPCYASHSPECVSAFSKDAIKPLRGVNVSDLERRKFQAIVARIRDMGFSGEGYEDFGFDDEDGDDADEEEEPQPRENVGSVERKKKEEDPDEPQVPPEDVPALLEQFVNSLDEPGKHLIFSTLNAALERNQMTSPTPSLQQQTKNKSPPSPKSKPKDIADVLEALTEEMEENDLSPDEILARLPVPLIRDFERRLHDGRLSTLVSIWRPWWIAAPENDEIQHVDNIPVEDGQFPPLPTANQLLVPLTVPTKHASAAIIHHAIDILAAYCLSIRLHNGDVSSDLTSAARHMWQFSAVLADDARPASLHIACTGVMHRMVAADTPRGAALEALQDVAAVLSGCSEWVARALFDCQRVFEGAVETGGTDRGGKRELKKRVRKIAYFVSWALCQDSESFLRAARGVIAFAEVEAGRAEEVRAAERAVRLAREKAKTDERPRIIIMD